MDEPKLHHYQYCFMTALFSLSGIFLPGIVRGGAGTGAFAAFALALLPGLALLALYSWLFSKKEGGALSVYSFAFGKKAARAVLVIYAAWFIYISAELIAFYGLYASSASELPSPALFILPMILGGCIAASRPASALGRLSVILGAPIAAAGALMLTASFFLGRWEQLFPLVSVSHETLLTVTLSLTALEYGQLLAVLCLSGALPDKKTLARTTLLSSLAGNALVLGLALASLLMEGQTSGLNGIGYAVSYTASGGMGGFRVISAAALFFSAIFRLSVCLRAAALCAGDAFNIKKRSFLVYIAGAVLFAVSLLLMTTTAELSSLLLQKSFYTALLPALALPLSAALVLLVKKRKKS